MSEQENPSTLDRLWNRLEARYGADELDDVGCDCAASPDAIDAFESSSLTRADVEAYENGDATMADLVSRVDADVDPGAIDGVDQLALALDRARQRRTTSPGTRS